MYKRCILIDSFGLNYNYIKQHEILPQPTGFVAFRPYTCTEAKCLKALEELQVQSVVMVVW